MGVNDIGMEKETPLSQVAAVPKLAVEGAPGAANAGFQEFGRQVGQGLKQEITGSNEGVGDSKEEPERPKVPVEVQFLNEKRREGELGSRDLLESLRVGKKSQATGSIIPQASTPERK